MEKLSLRELDKAVAILRAGGVVAYPTETSYALGCDATNAAAVEKIFAIKKRDARKPLLVIVDSVGAAKKYLRWNNLLKKIAGRYWPGPVTVVGEYRHSLFGGKLATGVIGSNGTIALRVSGADIPRFLAERLGRPLVATSANLAGSGDIYDAAVLFQTFIGKNFRPDAVIDAGALPWRAPTTIVAVLNGRIKILRAGEVKVDVGMIFSPPVGAGFLFIAAIFACLAAGAIFYNWRMALIEQEKAAVSVMAAGLNGE